MLLWLSYLSSDVIQLVWPQLVCVSYLILEPVLFVGWDICVYHSKSLNTKNKSKIVDLMLYVLVHLYSIV